MHWGDERQCLSSRDFLLLREHVLRLIALAQQPDDAARISISDEALQREALQRSASLTEERLAQPHALEHVIGDRFGEPARSVAWTQDRIEAHPIEVHDLVRVPRVPETGGEAIEDGMAERPRSGMCEDRQHVHQ